MKKEEDIYESILFQNLGIKIRDKLAEYYGIEKMGFVLIAFEFSQTVETQCRYISNADRKDMIKALRETADILEKGEDKQEESHYNFI